MVDMTDANTPLKLVNPTQTGPQPVDRRRRHRFVSAVVGGCITVAAIMSALGGLGVFTETYKALIELFVSGVIGIATAISLSYVAGSVIDYSLGSAFPKAKG